MNSASCEQPIPPSKAGNIQGSFMVESLNHIIGFAVPIAGYYLWGGGTGDPLPINYMYSGFLWGIKIGDITFDEVDILSGGKLSWVGDTGLNLTITNITTNAHVDLKVYLLWIIPMWGLRVNFNDLNVTAIVDFSQAYNRFPQLSLDLDLKYDKFDWGFFIVGWIVKLFLKEDKLISLVENALEGAIDGLNESLRNRNTDNFLVNIMQDLSANIGFTRPFTLDKENDLITFGLDGRIYNTTQMMYSNSIFQKEAVRFPRAHSNQIFIHQSTIESALRSVKRMFLPITISDPSFNQLLGIYIPELYEKYEGGSFMIEADANDDFDLSFNLIKGIALRNVGLDVVIYAKPKGFFKKYSKALEFSLTVDIPEIDVHIQELVVNTHIGEAKVSNAFLMDSKIGKIVRNNWDQFFESLINFQLNEVNVNNKQFDIKTLDPQIDLTSGQFPNSTVCFSYQEEFMYIGLKFFNDD
jgi:hypothetical protein